MAACSLAIGYPTVVSVPHSIVNGFKNLLAIAAETDVSFKEAEEVSATDVIRDLLKCHRAMAMMITISESTIRCDS